MNKRILGVLIISLISIPAILFLVNIPNLNLTGNPLGNGSGYVPPEDSEELYDGQDVNTYVSGWWDSDPTIIKCVGEFDTNVRAVGIDDLRTAKLYNEFTNYMWQEIWSGSPYQTRPNIDWSFLEAQIVGDPTDGLETAYWKKNVAIKINNALSDKIGETVALGEFVICKHQEIFFTVYPPQVNWYGAATNFDWETISVGDYVLFRPSSSDASYIYVSRLDQFNIVKAKLSGQFDKCTVVLKSSSYISYHEGLNSDSIYLVDEGKFAYEVLYP